MAPVSQQVTDEEARQLVSSVPIWFHSIDVGHGIVTKGAKSADLLARERSSLRLPDLRGKTVLDVGASDGYYSFAVEELGAASVTALDYYVWSMDPVEHNRHWRESKDRGVAPAPYHTMPYWQPKELPGKRGFDVAAQLRRSTVKPLVADFTSVDVAALGQFDVVLFLGVLYHLEDPLDAMRRVFSLTREVAIIETEAVFVAPFEPRAFFEFFGSNELNNDVSNWWAPNLTALRSLCTAAGFSRIVTVQGPPEYLSRARSRVGQAVRPRVRRYRAIVHAFP